MAQVPVGKRALFQATIAPAAVAEITWTSSDEGVLGDIVIDQANGRASFAAIASGQAVITATVFDVAGSVTVDVVQVDSVTVELVETF